MPLVFCSRRQDGPVARERHVRPGVVRPAQKALVVGKRFGGGDGGARELGGARRGIQEGVLAMRADAVHDRLQIHAEIAVLLRDRGHGGVLCRRPIKLADREDFLAGQAGAPMRGGVGKSALALADHRRVHVGDLRGDGDAQPGGIPLQIRPLIADGLFGEIPAGGKLNVKDPAWQRGFQGRIRGGIIGEQQRQLHVVEDEHLPGRAAPQHPVGQVYNPAKVVAAGEERHFHRRDALAQDRCPRDNAQRALRALDDAAEIGERGTRRQ